MSDEKKKEIEIWNAAIDAALRQIISPNTSGDWCETAVVRQKIQNLKRGG